MFSFWLHSCGLFLKLSWLWNRNSLNKLMTFRKRLWYFMWEKLCIIPWFYPSLNKVFNLSLKQIKIRFTVYGKASLWKPLTFFYEVLTTNDLCPDSDTQGMIIGSQGHQNFSLRIIKITKVVKETNLFWPCTCRILKQVTTTKISLYNDDCKLGKFVLVS